MPARLRAALLVLLAQCPAAQGTPSPPPYPPTPDYDCDAMTGRSEIAGGDGCSTIDIDTEGPCDLWYQETSTAGKYKFCYGPTADEPDQCSNIKVTDCFYPPPSPPPPSPPPPSPVIRDLPGLLEALGESTRPPQLALPPYYPPRRPSQPHPPPPRLSAFFPPSAAASRPLPPPTVHHRPPSTDGRPNTAPPTDLPASASSGVGSAAEAVALVTQSCS